MMNGWATVLTAVIGALLGGGGIGGIITILFRNKMERQQQSHIQSKDHQAFINDQNAAIIVRLEAEVKRLMGRIQKIEQSYDDIRHELANEYAKDIKLQAEANRLREENEQLRQIIKSLRGEK